MKSILFIPVLLSLLIALASKERSKKLDNGYRMIKYSLGTSMVFIGGPLFLIVMASYGFYSLPRAITAGEIITIVFLDIFLMILLLILSLTVRKTKIIFNNEKILSATLFGGSQKFLWNEIKKVSYSEKGRYFKLSTHNKKAFDISEFMAGIDDFIDELKAQLDEAIYREALNKRDSKV